jgi:ABC-2 type transport system ATP-binding protein
MTEIREKYKANTYSVQFTGDPDKLTGGLDSRFELLQMEQNGYGPLATIRITGGDGTGDLIRNLVEVTEIRSFQEILPSMNDIFIQVVNDASQNK